MTERENFLKMLDRAKVPYSIDGNQIVITVDRSTEDADHLPLKDYEGFTADFTFGDAGSLVEMSIWE